jgi:hypothetical protein
MIIFLIFKRFFCGPSGQATKREPIIKPFVIVFYI